MCECECESEKERERERAGTGSKEGEEREKSCMFNLDLTPVRSHLLRTIILILGHWMKRSSSRDSVRIGFFEEVDGAFFVGGGEV